MTRTLPWVSTPIAASTWLGRSALEVHAEPTPPRRPRRASSLDQHLAVGVEHAERHDVGEPVVGVADDLDVGHARPRRAAPGRPARGPSAPRLPRRAAVCRHASAAASTSGTHGRRVLAAVLGLAARAGQPPPGAGAHGEQAERRARRTTAASATSDRPGAGAACRAVAAQRRRRVEQQRDAVRAAQRVDVRRPAAGCRPRRWRSGAPRRRRRRPRARRRTPSRSTRPGAVDGHAACSRAGLERAATDRSVAAGDHARCRRGGGRAAGRSRPTSRAASGLGCTDSSSGRTPSASASTSRAVSSRARARRPGGCSRVGSAQPASRAAARVCAAGRVQRAPGGVEQAGDRRVDRGARHA